MKMKRKNSPQKPRKRRRKCFAGLVVGRWSASSSSSSDLKRLLSFVVIALNFANQICDIQSSTSIPSDEAAAAAALQAGSLANELSAVIQPTDNQPASRERIVAEPEDVSALVGQPADLSCIIENGHLDNVVWHRSGFTIASGPTLMVPYNKRFSLPGLEQPAASSSGALNYTLHIERVLSGDDQSDFVCLTNKSRSRPARLRVLQPPSWLDVVAKIEDPSDSGSTLMAAVVPSSKQPAHSNPADANEADADEAGQQITRILVRQNTRLRLECRSGPARPEPKLVWFDHQHRQVQDTFSVVQSSNGGAGVASVDNNDGEENNESSYQANHQSDGSGGGDSALVWSFVVQRHHNDHLLTCQAEHPSFQDGRRFPRLFGRQPRRQVRLEVQYEPEISLTKDQPQARENRPLRLHCEARARPNVLAYRWYIDDKPVANATEPELQISRLTRQMHQREIRCQVSNEVGSNSAVLRLSVQYAPAFVTHLLPASLQPQPAAFSDWVGSNSTSAGDQQRRRRPPEPSGRHELAIARQLALGAEHNQDVELRCDFDGHPRVSSVQWFKLASEYSIMGNVTPEESEDLIRGGALYATFKGAGAGDENGDDNENENDQAPGEGDADDRETRAIDYERMSLEELAEARLRLAGNASQSMGALEPLISQAPTPTSTLIFEPLDWSVGQEEPISTPAADSDPSTSMSVLQQRRQHRSLARQQQANQEQQQPITTLSLASRAFGSAEIESSSVHSSRDGLLWRQAEVASSRLLLRQVNVDSVGKYVCMARSAGSAADGQFVAARAVYLVLREKPRIISHPVQRAQLVSGRPRQISVECLAQINTILDNSTQIQWFRDGKLIEETALARRAEPSEPSSDDRRPTGIRNISIIVERSPDLLFMRSRLMIRAPTYGDFGVYNCTISNSHGVRDSMAINLQPASASAPSTRLVAAVGFLSVLVLACTIMCLLAFAPQRTKLAGQQEDDCNVNGDKAKVNKTLGASNSKQPTCDHGDQLDSAATTAAGSSTHGESDTDSLQKSQASSEHPATLSEGPIIDDPSAHIYAAGAANGLHLLSKQQQQAHCHYMQLSEQQYLQQQQQQQPPNDRQTIYHPNGWPSMGQPHHHQQQLADNTTNGHYQMPSSMVAPALAQQPPPLPPAPQSNIIVESPYVSNGRTYYSSASSNRLVPNGHYAAAPLASSNQVMVTTDGEAQFESQYGSMLSNAYRVFHGYSTTSSPSSGGSGVSSSSSGAVNSAPTTTAPLTIGAHHQHSSGSASSSPNSMTTYHNLRSGGYISTLSLQQNHALLTQQPSPPSSDVLLMKSSDNKQQPIKLQDTETYLAASNNNIIVGNNNSGLATHV